MEKDEETEHGFRGSGFRGSGFKKKMNIEC